MPAMLFKWKQHLGLGDKTQGSQGQGRGGGGTKIPRKRRKIEGCQGSREGQTRELRARRTQGHQRQGGVQGGDPQVALGVPPPVQGDRLRQQSQIGR